MATYFLLGLASEAGSFYLAFFFVNRATAGGVREIRIFRLDLSAGYFLSVEASEGINVRPRKTFFRFSV